MNEASQPSRLIRARRFTLRWLGRSAATFLLVYVGFLTLGCVPVNRNYQVPPESDSVTILIRSNEIHADLVFPVFDEQTGRDWHELFPPADFQRNVSHDEYVAIGWGNRVFFVDTPTWEDFKFSTAAKGLFTPSESVLHVEYVPLAYTGDYFPVRITHSQYQTLCEHVDRTIGKLDEQGHAVPATPKTHGTSDRFYLSTGTYHLFSTCNQWVGRGLKLAGVPTGLWTPLQQHVLIWLPEKKGGSGN
jgi:uncharacterized protein (TIGR02117 family)